jgi:glycosyltransferase involved in cell wall biosynthesis
MGGLDRKPEVKLLLGIARWLRDHGSSEQVVVIGRGQFLSMAQRQRRAEQLENLEITGRIPWDDMLLRLRHAGVLLLPLEDSLDNRTRCPFKALQYAQAGRPIIATRVGEIPELLGSAPDYQPFSAKAFGRAVQRVLQDEAPPVSHNLDRHSWKDRANRLEALLLTVRS